MDTVYDLLILGGGSAGLAAGIYAGRSQMKTLIIEKMIPGGQLMTTSEVANYPGVRKVTGPDLIQEMQLQATDFGVEFVTDQIDRVDFNGPIKRLYAQGKEYKGYGVILACGAVPRLLGFKGETEFMGHGVSFCATCDGGFFTGLDVFVIGGGYAAVEESLYLTRFAKTVTVVVRKDKLSAPLSAQDKLFSHPKIKVLFNTEIIEARGEMVLTSATFRNNKTGEEFTYTLSPTDRTFGIFVFAGYTPETALFKGLLQLDEQGYILTDENMATSIPGIYAAGDLRPKALRQIVTAVADGAIAATAAEKYITNEKSQR